MSDACSNAGLDDAAIARKKLQAEDLARAKEAGWNNPIPFKYDTVVGGEAAPDETRETAPWLSDAAVYQWDDEFGDVGERNPDLERMLFEDSDLQRIGKKIDALSFNVDVEGPEKIQPVRSVSSHNLFPLDYSLMSTVRGCWSPSRDGRQRQAVPVHHSHTHSVILHPIGSDWP
jgi:ATP-dependent RNA helicase DDX3X